MLFIVLQIVIGAMKLFSDSKPDVRNPAFGKSCCALPTVLIALALVATSFPLQASLDVYFVDVEGGQATLIVTPEGRSVLFDAGYPGKGASESMVGDPMAARDANRILAAATHAGISKINYVVISHFHRDHFGGVMELSQLIDIDTLIDRGSQISSPGTEKKWGHLLTEYKRVRGQLNHMEAQVGEHLVLGSTRITFISVGGHTLKAPIEAIGNTLRECDMPPITPSESFENPRSIGIVVQFGAFRLLNLGDLVGQPLWDLACPGSKVGRVDVYLVPHHAGSDAAHPATLAAFQPRVAIISNGETKGGAAETLELLHADTRVEGVWQLHRSETAGDQNARQDRIANLDERNAHWLKLSASRDGGFSVLNGRTGKSEHYVKR